jgi:starvation-inducible DNA-binding protein
MEANIGLTAKTRKEVAELLNHLLCDEMVIYIKTLKFHWNVYGIVFHDFHKMFKEQYEIMLDVSDEVAERVRALGHYSLGSMTEFLKHTRLKEEPGKVPDPLGMIKILLADHEAVIRQIRKDVEACEKLGDAGTSNFLQDLMETHEKLAWMLRATATK